MTRSKAVVEDEDKARLKSVWHSIKKLFLRYVLLVSFSFKNYLKYHQTHTLCLFFIHFTPDDFLDCGTLLTCRGASHVSSQR